jgi:adenylate cyclase
MPVRERSHPENRQGSESSGNSWISQETVRHPENQPRDPNKSSASHRNAECFPGSLTMDTK